VSWAQGADVGKVEYLSSCASCHGVDGKGNGSVSAQLKAAPADLTVLAKKNNGVFPVSRVYEGIDGRQAIVAHGPRDMPVWGLRYNALTLDQVQQAVRGHSSFDPEATARARILSLVDYLNRIQEK
jgi:mono/diheme cytochrome c family protein